ncbi:hypothetical protein DTO271D3_7181 [Paecilomyces variotii]|nr:hypothetical protein DTO271D3_7181 [Paecilomyces variotii]
MSYYQNGQSAYYGRSSNSPAVPPQQAYPYETQCAYGPPQDQHIRRVPSYDPGDDTEYFENAQGQGMRPPDNAGYPVQGGHGVGGGYAYTNASSGQGSLGSRRSQFSADSSQQSQPSRASSHGSALSGYQRPYQGPSSASPTQSVYNPQQFARPHIQPQVPTGYNPQGYTGMTNSQYNGSAHPSYNPAAYQSTSLGGYAGTQRQPYAMNSAQAPPPPPPRGPEHPYGARRPNRYANSSPDPQYNYPSPTHHASSPTAPRRSSVYGTAPGHPSVGPHRGSDPGSVPQPYPYESRVPSSPSLSQFPAPPAHVPRNENFHGKRLSISNLPGRGSLPTTPTYPTSTPSSPRRTDTLTRHPQARPLPGPPVDSDDGTTLHNGIGNRHQSEDMSYDDLLKEVEAAVSVRRGSRETRFGQGVPDHAEVNGHIPSSALRLSPDERHTHTNGSIATGTGQYVNYGAYSDDSDAEAEAGLAMLQMADEEEKAMAERQRTYSGTAASIFSAYGSHSSDRRASTYQDTGGDDNEYVSHDLSVYGGGYEGHVHYGDNNDTSPGLYDRSRPPTTSGSFHSSSASVDGHPALLDEYYYQSSTLPSDARVDTGGTGGLSEPDPTGRRLSFDDGEETEETYMASYDEDMSDSQGPENGEPEDLFFHPGMRPLPPAPVEPADNAVLRPHLMPAGTYRHAESRNAQPGAQYREPPYPSSPDIYGQPQVPRSASLSSHSSTPRTDPPIRSKTDSDRAKYKQQQELLRQQQAGSFGYDATLQPSAVALDLPTIPAGRRKKFNPAKLSSEQFNRCSEPWALSSVVAWIKDLSEDETDLKEQAIIDAIVALFTHKVPTMNTADAETLGARVVKNMLAEQALVKEEEWVKFGPGSLSGVLFQITGTGCYSSKLHEEETEVFGRCYSHHCMRTLKKVDLKAQVMESEKKTEDWVTFYKVPKEVWESYPRKEIDRQNNLHEIVTTEDLYIGQLDVLRELYRDQLATAEPAVMNPKRLNKFLNDVFGKVDPVKQVNEDHLLAQLKYRQKEQGPFIVGFSDIFREWIRKAKTVYIDYAATFPHANYLIRKEAERNIHFRTFLNQARDNKMSNRLSWDTYLKAPITRIQRYTLLLATVHKNMVKDSEEKTNLAQAIEEIKVVALDCDAKVGEMSKKVELMELSSKLQLRPEMKKEVELNLEHLGRQIIFEGELQRPGSRTRFNLVDTHAILFDHYLVLAKAVTTRDPTRTLKYETYDVSKLPIPMDLLVLESTNDDPVVKSALKGISAVAGQPQAMSRTGGSNTISHVNSNSTLVPSTTLDSSRDDNILYPFRIKHLGKTGTYTLYASTAQNRQDWCDKIIEAKTKHAASLFAQNAEPFHLRVLADAAFGYSDQVAGYSSVVIEGTPLDRAIKDVEYRYAPAGPRPPPICRAPVNCATVFQQPQGRMMCAIGTDYGVYISDYNDARGWKKAMTISVLRVTQIAVFEEFNLFLVIADKSLIAYHLDAVCPASGVTTQATVNDSARKAPQKLSGSHQIGFFAAGRMKDRTLIMYKKRDGMSSTFKVLEPVLQKSTSSRNRFFNLRRGQTEFFREYDEFYIPAESYGINMFHSSLAISTQRGIEVLTLDKKLPWTVPNLRSDIPEAQPYLTSIANRIKDLRPLGMFRLSDSEFLVAYSECAVYVNKHGDVSRSVVMEFVGRAHTACLCGKFLILLNEDFIEVRNAMNGRLRQVIPGHNVVCLDDGSSMPGSGNSGVSSSSMGGNVNFSGGAGGRANGTSATSSGRTVKVCMQHPEFERCQIVVELVENELQQD